MRIHYTTDRHELPSGTLELLILRSVSRDINERSDGTLLIEEGSLYPALHRLVRLKQLKAEWGTGEHNRKARFYTSTAAGRRSRCRCGKQIAATSRVVVQALAHAQRPPVCQF